MILYKQYVRKLMLLMLLVVPMIPLTIGYKLEKDTQPMDASNLVFDECGNSMEESKGAKETCNIKVVSSKHKASSIAIKAAQEAKAASDAQLPAAENAAHQVIIQLADKALAAAKAAEAALAGKQQIVEQLESEVREGELVVQEEAASLQSSQGNCNAAAQASKQAGVQVKTLAEAVRNAQANVHNSDQAANGAQQELAEKQQLVEAAKKRVELLLRQLDLARTDYKSTKKAAEHAACAAQEAKQRATRERRMTEIRAKLQRRHMLH
ncbi:uncharacterized protein CG45076 [Drosophila sulfurigaster albostrigata]|uniref:uncharacterized protein CG45076 n=1 Tax=Drosophila sulfurigaster albostrigata TaxID=89887 RepID=UPI002D21BB34|nr:uncharacterized protein CG45076 [Drosophila sulfurigaster albostrigata]